MNPPLRSHCLALEVGGTRLGAALVGQDGHFTGLRRTETPVGGGAAILDRLLWLASQCVSDTGIAPAAAGISAAGVIDIGTGMVLRSGDTLPGWQGTSLSAPVADRFACPAYAANDAQCALEGELWKGGHVQPAGAPVVLLTLGTGLGGAWALEGNVIRGRFMRAGHFGHPRRFHALLGRMASLEETVSGSGLCILHRTLHGEDAGPAPISGPALMASCAQGDARARATVETWTAELAALIADLGWMFDPGLVILGGGVIGSREVWWPLLEHALGEIQVDTPVAPATLGNDAGLAGAAHLAWSGLP